MCLDTGREASHQPNSPHRCLQQPVSLETALPARPRISPRPVRNKEKLWDHSSHLSGKKRNTIPEWVYTAVHLCRFRHSEVAGSHNPGIVQSHACKNTSPPPSHLPHYSFHQILSTLHWRNGVREEPPVLTTLNISFTLCFRLWDLCFRQARWAESGGGGVWELRSRQQLLIFHVQFIFQTSHLLTV